MPDWETAHPLLEVVLDEFIYRESYRSSPPPSSPPAFPKRPATQTDMPPSPPPSRKRSREEVFTENSSSIPKSIMTGGGDLQAKDCDSQTQMQKVPASSSMAPPPLSSMPPPPPRSGQDAPSTAANAKADGVANGGKQSEQQATQRDEQQAKANRDEDETSDSDDEPPGEALVEFDWMGMESRYHDKMNELREDDEKIFAEFDRLCNYFNIWANVLPEHEVERSFKRLKTQTFLVQHQEHELEEKRQHYITIVRAFQSALSLLALAQKK